MIIIAFYTEFCPTDKVVNWDENERFRFEFLHLERKKKNDGKLVKSQNKATAISLSGQGGFLWES